MVVRGGRSILTVLRRFSQESASPGGASAGAPRPVPPAAPPSVPGLSAAVVRPPGPVEGPQVPGDKSGEYKVPEYFCYDTMSYYEAEIEMAKHRLPQPSAL